MNVPETSSHYFTPQAPLAETKSIIQLEWKNHPMRFATGDGVFAKSGLDTGSRLLLQTALPHLANLPANALLCDLGCGWGAVGCIMAHELPQAQIMMSDVNPRAVALAQHNAQLNQLENITAWCGDGLAATKNNSFHAILCNPPIRAGNAVMARLFEDSLRCLLPNGDLYLVIRTAQGAKSWEKRLKVLFGNCEELDMKKGYRLLVCKKALGSA